MAIGAEILTLLRAEAGQFKSEIAGATGTTEKFASATDKMASVGKAALIGLGAVAVGVATLSVAATNKYEEAHVRLVNAIKNTGSSWDEQADRVEKVSSSLRKLGFTDTDTESSLVSLVGATKDTKTAVDLMGLAADIAAGRGISLAAATGILTRVETGRISGLAKLNINIKDNEGNMISQAVALDRLRELYGGAAADSAETFAGKMRVLQADLDHVAVQIGEVLIPILLDLVNAGASVIDFLSRHQALAIALAIVIGGPLVAAMALYIAQLAIAAGTSLISTWETLVDAAGSVVDGIQAIVGALIAQVTAQEASNTASAVQTGSLKSLAVSLESGFSGLRNFTAAQGEAAAASSAASGAVAVSGSALAGLATTAGIVVLAIGAVVGAAVLLSHVFGDGDAFQGEIDAADRLAKSDIKLYESTLTLTGQQDALKQRLREVGDLRAHEQTLVDNATSSLLRLHNAQAIAGDDYAKATRTLDETLPALAESNRLYDDYSKKLAILGPQIEAQEKAQRKANAETSVAASLYGVTLPNSLNLTVAQNKALEGSIGAVTRILGVDATQAVVNLTSKIPDIGIAFQNALKQTDSFASGIQGAVSKFTDAFGTFKVNQDLIDAFGIDAQSQFNSFFVNTQQQASDWANQITDLIGRGVDQGLIDQMARAGPESEGNLKLFLGLIDTYGVDAVNKVAGSASEAAQVTSQAYGRMAVEAAIKSTEASAIGDAFFKDLNEKGTKNLEKLAGSADDNFNRMVYAALTQLPAINFQMEKTSTASIGAANRMAFGVINAIGSVPNDNPKSIRMLVEDGDLLGLETRLEKLVSHTWTVVTEVISDRNRKLDIVPVSWN